MLKQALMHVVFAVNWKKPGLSGLTTAVPAYETSRASDSGQTTVGKSAK